MRIFRVIPFAVTVVLAQADIYFSPVFDTEEASSGLESITSSDLEAHLTFLASDVTEGRATGEAGLQVAAEYIASQFRRLGLTPLANKKSYFQRYELFKTKLGVGNELSLLMDRGAGSVREVFEYGEDFFVSPRGLTGSIEIQAPVLYAGYGITADEYRYDDYSGISAKNTIILVIDGEPELDDPSRFNGASDTRFADLRQKVETAKKNGTSAVIVASNPKSNELFSGEFNRWRRWLRRESMSLPTSEVTLPVFTISETTADRIVASSGKTLRELQVELESKGTSNSQSLDGTYIHLDVDLEKEAIVSQNVAAYFPGSDPNIGHETVVVSAHYDHVGKNEEGQIYYGADDNGTGTSALMEIAEAVVKNKTAPRRGFLFLAVSGEERGLLGSKHYANKPLLPLENTVTDLNIDMVGRNAPDSVYVIGSNMISQDLHEINEFAASKMDDFFLNYRYNSKDHPQRFYYRSDHYNFAEFGIPIIFYFAGVHADYHKPTDTVDKINFHKLEKVARLVFLTGWGVAQNDARPRKNAGQLPKLPDKIKY